MNRGAAEHQPGRDFLTIRNCTRSVSLPAVTARRRRALARLISPKSLLPLPFTHDQSHTHKLVSRLSNIQGKHHPTRRTRGTGRADSPPGRRARGHALSIPGDGRETGDPLYGAGYVHELRHTQACFQGRSRTTQSRYYGNAKGGPRNGGNGTGTQVEEELEPATRPACRSFDHLLASGRCGARTGPSPGPFANQGHR